MIITKEEQKDFEQLKLDRIFYNQFKDKYNELEKGLITANITAWYNNSLFSKRIEMDISINSNKLSKGVIWKFNNVISQRISEQIKEDLEVAEAEIKARLKLKEDRLKKRYSLFKLVTIQITALSILASAYFLYKLF